MLRQVMANLQNNICDFFSLACTRFLFGADCEHSVIEGVIAFKGIGEYDFGILYLLANLEAEFNACHISHVVGAEGYDVSVTEDCGTRNRSELN